MFNLHTATLHTSREQRLTSASEIKPVSSSFNFGSKKKKNRYFNKSPRNCFTKTKSFDFALHTRIWSFFRAIFQWTGSRSHRTQPWRVRTKPLALSNVKWNHWLKCWTKVQVKRKNFLLFLFSTLKRKERWKRKKNWQQKKKRKTTKEEKNSKLFFLVMKFFIYLFTLQHSVWSRFRAIRKEISGKFPSHFPPNFFALYLLQMKIEDNI